MPKSPPVYQREFRPRTGRAWIGKFILAVGVIHAVGALVILLGALTNWCEKCSAGLPRFFGWSLLGLTVLLTLLMPVSGGWLLLVPSVGAILRARTATTRDA